MSVARSLLHQGPAWELCECKGLEKQGQSHTSKEQVALGEASGSLFPGSRSGEAWSGAALIAPIQLPFGAAPKLHVSCSLLPHSGMHRKWCPMHSWWATGL